MKGISSLILLAKLLLINFFYVSVENFNLKGNKNNNSTNERNDTSLIKVILKKKLLEETFKNLNPIILEEFKEIKIDNIQYSIDVGLGSIDTILSNILIQLKDKQVKKFELRFLNTDCFLFSLHELNIDGSFHGFFKYGIIEENAKISILGKVLELNSMICVGLVESKISRGKYLPFININDMKLNIDYSLNLNGGLIAKLSDLILDSIKSHISENVNRIVRKICLTELNKLLSTYIHEIPILVNLGDVFPLNRMILDSSFIEKPILENDNIILSLNGSFVIKEKSNVKSTSIMEKSKLNRSHEDFFNIENKDILDDSPFRLNLENLSFYMGKKIGNNSGNSPVSIFCKLFGPVKDEKFNNLTNTTEFILDSFCSIGFKIQEDKGFHYFL